LRLQINKRTGRLELGIVDPVRRQRKPVFAGLDSHDLNEQNHPHERTHAGGHRRPAQAERLECQRKDDQYRGSQRAADPRRLVWADDARYQRQRRYPLTSSDDIVGVVNQELAHYHFLLCNC